MLNFIGDLEGLQMIVATLALLLVLLVSLSLHEYAHAFVAYKQGDDTAKLMGRLTLNPLAHIDPIGFICCAFFGFGWAKPVPVNPLKFRNYKKGVALVSIAGVTVNFILAFIFCGLLYLFNSLAPVNESNFTLFIHLFLLLMYTINLCLFIFNLLPIYPLDGFNLISSFTKYNNKFLLFMRNYGFAVLMAVLIFGDGLLIKIINLISLPINLFWGLIF